VPMEMIDTSAPATSLEPLILAAWEDPVSLTRPQSVLAVEETIRLLDAGTLRVATRGADGWAVHEWLKKAIILYFRIQTMETMELGPYEYHDKIPLKRGYARLGVRVVPPA